MRTLSSHGLSLKYSHLVTLPMYNGYLMVFVVFSPR